MNVSGWNRDIVRESMLPQKKKRNLQKKIKSLQIAKARAAEDLIGVPLRRMLRKKNHQSGDRRLTRSTTIQVVPQLSSWPFHRTVA
mmetsp:Transcript_3202/g.8204  ORF Transcript_3202/g.8204 Transcript_3202/m.8204 type:complete len:86 (-) Transcript_3202:626-883(-)